MFNRLEIDIFKWFKETYPQSTLADQLTTANLVRRQWTRVGFYVDFEVDKNLSRLKMDEYGGSFPISGPGIESEDIHYNGGCLLWGNDGYVDCLEMFAYGNFFKEEVNKYKLVTSPKAI